MSAFALSPNELVQLIETPKENASAALERLGGTAGVADALNVKLDYGLDTSSSSNDLEERQQVFGKNFVEPPRPKSFLELMWDAFQVRTLLLDT